MRKFIGIALLVVLLASCGIEEGVKTRRGRGDAPATKHINQDAPDYVIEMQDGWGNVATKCAYTGWRVFVSTKAAGASSIAVVADPKCVASDNYHAAPAMKP